MVIRVDYEIKLYSVSNIKYRMYHRLKVESRSGRGGKANRVRALDFHWEASVSDIDRLEDRK